jgi:hypothetical protein
MGETHPPTRQTPTDAGAPPISTVVVEAVADAKDVSVLELPPLSRVVDPEALNRLVESVDGDPAAPGTAVEFQYADYLVTVRGDESVFLAALDH